MHTLRSVNPPPNIHVLKDVPRNLIPSGRQLDIIQMHIHRRRKAECELIEYPPAVKAAGPQQHRCITNLSLTPENIYDSLYTELKHSYHQIIELRVSTLGS